MTTAEEFFDEPTQLSADSLVMRNTFMKLCGDLQLRQVEAIMLWELAFAAGREDERNEQREMYAATKCL